MSFHSFTASQLLVASDSFCGARTMTTHQLEAVSSLTGAAEKISGYNDLLTSICNQQNARFEDSQALYQVLESIFAQDSIQLIERPIIQHVKSLLASTISRAENRRIVMEKILHETQSRSIRLEDELWSIRFELAKLYEAEGSYMEEVLMLKSIELERGLDVDEKLRVIVQLLDSIFKLKAQHDATEGNLTKEQIAASDTSSLSAYINDGKECINERTTVELKQEFWSLAAQASYLNEAYAEAYELCSAYLTLQPSDSTLLQLIAWSAICALRLRPGRSTNRQLLAPLLADRGDAIRQSRPALHIILLRLHRRQFISQSEIGGIPNTPAILLSIHDNNLAFIARTFKNISIDHLTALLGTTTAATMTQSNIAEWALEAQKAHAPTLHGYIDEVNHRVVFEDDDERSDAKSNATEVWDAHIKLLCTAVDRTATSIEAL